MGADPLALVLAFKRVGPEWVPDCPVGAKFCDSNPRPHDNESKWSGVRNTPEVLRPQKNKQHTETKDEGTSCRQLCTAREFGTPEGRFSFRIRLRWWEGTHCYRQLPFSGLDRS